MAGLVPAISFHVAMPCQIIEIAGTSASQATPFFKRLCPAMTASYTLNSFSALPWAMRSRSAALTGICSRKVRAAAIEPYG